MKITIFLIIGLLAYIPIITHQECVEQCLQMLFFGCKVCYQTCNHQTVQFEKCSHTYCAQYVTYQNTTQCIRYQTDYYTETSCLPKCCHEGDIEGSTFSLQNIKQCKEGNDSSFGALMGGIFGGIGLIILICVCCACSSKQCWSSICDCLCSLITCRPCRKKFEELNDKSGHRNSQTHFKADQQQSKQWKNDDSNITEQILNSYTNCSICLEMNNDCVTKCGHSFHASCIDEWFRKKRSCPNCVSSQMNPVKVYCRCCMKRYVDYDLAGSTRYGQFIGLIKGPNCSMCQ